MEIMKMEPVGRPDSVHLEDALPKGLGRALLWAKKGLWRHKDLLLHACLHDLRYDRQCEESRGPWLWQLLEATGTTDEFRDAIFESLTTIDDGLAGQQRCELAVFYGRRGDDRFRQKLREIAVRKPDPTCPWLAEQELLDLEGEAGFLLIAQHRGASLAARGWDWDDRSFVAEAMAKLGEATVLELLAREAQTSSAMKRLHDGWLAAQVEDARPQIESHAERMRNISLSTVIDIAEAKQRQAGLLRGWGKHAQDADLDVIRDRLFNTQDPATLAHYLWIFSNRPLREFDVRFLDLLDHADEQVRFRAFAAIGMNAHPAIRQFALDHLHDRIVEDNFLELFIRNFEPGDEARILHALPMPADIDQRHAMLMDLCHILENNPQSKCAELAEIIYFWTPCGNCRYNAVKRLIERQVAPPWLIEECCHDAMEDIRQLATTP